ncbi:MAG TPA: dTDP-Rha--alpha-D-GlcNAc-pyrophosphate polyprenol alpha-3-L-rhamnosyltransferase, partial [Bacteroidales bacterium]|nr:dTDP-Rha--alpha-D-GlcNAc-pyrophosphate polyprenol alpha-3-L-rhamnosyltransferase [Bacteroidales bacterium]
MKFPLVSIITVNYNQAASTLALIESLTKITYPNIELLVVDNDSTIENAKRINHIFPSVRIIKSPINYGFAAGNNLGIMQAKGKYILLLNNDVVVTPNFLEPLISRPLITR